MASKHLDEVDDLHFRVLKLLQEDPHMWQRALAQKLGVSNGKLRYCIRALIEKGLVQLATLPVRSITWGMPIYSRERRLRQRRAWQAACNTKIRRAKDCGRRSHRCRRKLESDKATAAKMERTGE